MNRPRWYVPRERRHLVPPPEAEQSAEYDDRDNLRGYGDSVPLAVVNAHARRIRQQGDLS